MSRLQAPARRRRAGGGRFALVLLLAAIAVERSGAASAAAVSDHRRPHPQRFLSAWARRGPSAAERWHISRGVLVAFPAGNSGVGVWFENDADSGSLDVGQCRTGQPRRCRRPNAARHRCRCVGRCAPCRARCRAQQRAGAARLSDQWHLSARSQEPPRKAERSEGQGHYSANGLAATRRRRGLRAVDHRRERRGARRKRRAIDAVGRLAPASRCACASRH